MPATRIEYRMSNGTGFILTISENRNEHRGHLVHRADFQPAAVPHAKTVQELGTDEFAALSLRGLLSKVRARVVELAGDIVYQKPSDAEALNDMRR